MKEDIEAHIRNERDALRNWPYTVHRLDDTLDAELIEGRARQILYQSINARRLMVGLGSGASMSYGRLTWGEWINTLRREIEWSRQAFDTLCLTVEALLREIENELEQPEWESWTEVPQHDKLKTGVSVKMKREVLRQMAFDFRKEVLRARHAVEVLRPTFANVLDTKVYPGGDGNPIKLQALRDLHEEIRRQSVIFLEDVGEDAPPLGLFGEYKRRLKDLLEQLPPRYSGGEKTKNFQDAFEKFRRFSARTAARESFDNFNKILLADERPHSRSLLLEGLLEPGQDPNCEKALEDALKFDKELKCALDTENLKRTLDSVRSRPETYHLLTPFLFRNVAGSSNTATLLNLAKQANTPGWSNILDSIESLLEKYQEKRKDDGLGTRAFITPSTRFLVTVLLRLLGPHKAEDWIKDNMKEAPPRTSLDSRRSVIAERFDPIAKLVKNLHVNRILTFNYDLEVERYYQDMGYRVLTRGEEDKGAAGAPEPSRLADLRSDGVGTLLRDAAFDPERASELVTFAVGADGADAAVYHFHGRCADGDIVATERDYMKLYLRRSETRPGVDEAVTLTLSARPAFFVGFGMTEDEILRPLRQFISDDDRRAGYRTVVLMTGDKPHGERTAWSAMLYQRYGVHTIWHGGGTINVEGEDKSVPIDWLYRVLKLINALTDIANARLDQALKKEAQGSSEVDQAINGGSDKVRALLDKRVGKLGEVVDTEHKNKSALALLCGALYDNISDTIKIKIKPCLFGTHPSVGRSGKHSDVTIDGEKHCGFYIECLNGLMPMLINSYGLDDSCDECKARALHASIAMLDGLYGAFMTASMNAALDLIAAGHRLWWKDWQQRPEPREPRFEELEPEPDAKWPDLPRRYIRHRVLNTFTNLAAAERVASKIPSNRKADLVAWKADNQLGVRSFDSFIDAVAHYEWAGANLKEDPKRKIPGGRGRRIYAVLAGRGLGKGTFLSAFATRLGTTAFIQAAWRGQQPKPPYLAAIFINLSFSSEIGSVYDMLKGALIKAVLDAECGTEDATPNESAQSNLKKRRAAVLQTLDEVLFDLRRSASLRYLIMRLQEGRSGGRVLIAIGGAGLLLETDGRFKNGEIAAILTRILDEIMADAPFDLVLIGDEQPLGNFLVRTVNDDTTKPGKPRQGMHLVHLERANLPDEAKTALRIRAKEIGLGHLPCPDEADLTIEKKNGFDGSDIDARRIFVNFPRSVQPVEMLVDNFPVLAGCIAAQAVAAAHGVLENRHGERAGDLQIVEWDSEDGTYKQVPNAEKQKEQIQSLRNDDATTLKTVRALAIQRRKKQKNYWSGPELPLDDLNKDLPEIEKDVMDKVAEYLKFAPLPEKLCGGDAVKGEVDMAKKLRGDDQTSDEAVSERLRLRYKLNRRAPDIASWREIRRALGANRFSLTLLLAAAEELALTESTVLDAGQTAVDFIYRVLDQVWTSSASQREATVLNEVMALYERLHVMDLPETNFDFQKRLLRVLAAAGAATSADVLAHAPEVQRFFTGSGASFNLTAEMAVRAALNALTRRGLVFRLSPHPMLTNSKDAKADAEADAKARYGLHRLVSHQLLRHFGTISSEPIRANAFAPSLYAAMPSGVARLRLSSYQFLSEQMLGLAQYPDLPARSPLGAEAASMPALAFLDAEPDTKVQALRAALAMARSSFSIAVVSRFEDYADDLKEPLKLPFFDEYKVRLRWLIRKAWEEDAQKDTLRPLYRDEIVWLYNEVGLASLVQGNLTDAVAHLRQAIYLNQEIEGREGGPLQARISLNLAITQIERGHPAAARARLQRIVDGIDVNDPIVSKLAQGYVGVCDHLDGRLPQAAKNLEAATDFFRQTKQFRAFAVLSNHHARLVMLTDPEEAVKMLTSAQRAAEAGGHEDVRRHIILSEIRAELDVATKGSAEDRERARDAALPRLRSTLDYARLMGLRSLEVDALVLRANLMLDKSEVDPAGELLVPAMGVAARNEQNLRLSRALSIYGRVILGRGRHEELAHVLPDLLARAKAIGHRTEVFALQRLVAELDAMRR